MGVQQSKKKILFLVPYPQGIGPSQRFRFEQYLGFLSEDYDYSEWSFWNRKSWDVIFSDANPLVKFYYVLLAFLKRWVSLFKGSNFRVSMTNYEIL